MNKKSENNDSVTFLDILIIVLGFIGISSILSLFHDDSSKIVSKKGEKILSSPKEMEEINKLIDSKQSSEHYSEIVI
ncbi:hypothetical protein QYS49_32955 [Marivirga salinae]|uniref:Uncharacterized protein n=1 Tax=Marivirga salinarum TaxID=3059078 RepID=A0AA51NBT6_9BACT|nr:hypothetical protein [Marivirga sp. BDSF4-3]WMN12248.1 hypothetical protein QYS49_32955 [Marivirga sp. BDSF4-3]